jgi:hypothetical protein
VKRKKRNLQGEQIRPVTLELRAGVHDKLEALVPAGSSLVETVEYMTEFYFARRLRRIGRDNQQNEN